MCVFTSDMNTCVRMCSEVFRLFSFFFFFFYISYKSALSKGNKLFSPHFEVVNEQKKSKRNRSAVYNPCNLWLFDDLKVRFWTHFISS